MGNLCTFSDAAVIAFEARKLESSTLGTEAGTLRDFTESSEDLSHIHRNLTNSIKSDNNHQSVLLPRVNENNTEDENDPTVLLPFQRSLCYVIPPPSMEELGSIRYSHKDNVERAKDEGLPILLVKAQVPGDKNTGSNILSHPLIVEAAESLFATVCITSDDRANLTKSRRCLDQKFLYTTIHFLDTNGEELVPMIDGDVITLGMMVQGMVKALKLSNQTVPMYLDLLNTEASGKEEVIPTTGVIKKIDRTAYFGVTDCPLAEVEFAELDEVLSTQVGLYQGQKVIAVTYARGTSFAGLLRFAMSKRDIVHTVYYQTCDERIAAQMEVGKCISNPLTILKFENNNSSNANEQHGGIVPLYHEAKYALRKTEMRFVPLTNLQATRANRLIHFGSFHKATHLLSPRQGAILMKTYSNVSLRTDAVDIPIVDAWKRLNNTCSEECECRKFCRPDN